MSPDNPHPFNHEMYFYGDDVGTSDRYSIDYHGLAHSHLDALCHFSHHGKMYNGFSLEEISVDGCRKDSVHALSDGVFTRGVLIDIAYLSGASSLEAGTAIMSSDLDAWEKRTKVKIQPGDAVLIRTGRWLRRDEGKSNDAAGAAGAAGKVAGLHASAIKWLRDRDISIVGSDWPVENEWPTAAEGLPPGGPVHTLLLVAMGTPILDNLDLEQLRTEAERQGRWDFLFTLAPLRVQGGTGSPVNPIAVF